MYSKKTKSLEKNQIDLREAFVQHDISHKSQKRNKEEELIFRLCTAKKEYKFKALTRNDKERWLVEIEKITAKNDQKAIEQKMHKNLEQVEIKPS